MLKSQYKKHSRYNIQCFSGSMIKHITTDYLLTTRSNSTFNFMVCKFIEESSNGNKNDELPIQTCTFKIKQLKNIPDIIYNVLVEVYQTYYYRLSFNN